MSHGLRWFLGVADHAGRLLTVAALVVGVPAGLALLALGWWAVLVGVGVLLLLVLGEGAFRVWREADEAYDEAAGERDLYESWEREEEQDRALRDLLALFVKVGGDLVKSSGPDPIHIRGWKHDVEQVIGSAFGYQEQVLFLDTASGGADDDSLRALAERLDYMRRLLYERYDQVPKRKEFDADAYLNALTESTDDQGEGESA